MDRHGRIKLKDNMKVSMLHHDDGKGDINSHEVLILIDDGEDFTFKIQAFADSEGVALRLAISKVDSAMDSLYQAGMDLKKKLYDGDIIKTSHSLEFGEVTEEIERDIEEHHRRGVERRWQ